MINQVKSEEIKNYIYLFKDNKYLGEVLRGYMQLGLCDCYIDNLKEIGVCSIFDGNVWFLGGKKESSNLEGILAKVSYNNAIFVPNYEWVELLSNYWSKLVCVKRTLFSSKNLSLDYIQSLIKPLKDNFLLEKINFETAKKIQSPNYPADEKLLKQLIQNGIGFCIKENSLDDDNKIVGYVTSVKEFDYEIDINVNSEHRKKGFATLLSAKLIEYCLQHNIIPHWDAANEISAKLAKKLGFTDPIEYNIYVPIEIWPEDITDVRKAFHGLTIAQDILKGLESQITDKKILNSIQVSVNKIELFVKETEIARALQKEK